MRKLKKPTGSPKVRTEIVRLAGKDTRVQRIDIPLDLVDLDPTNPRIGMASDSKPGGGPLTQREAEFALRRQAPDAYDKLKLAIESNKGLIYPIWVTSEDGGRYRVVEGNTRLLVYQDLLKKFLKDPTWSAIPARVLPSDVDPQIVHFVRVESHLRGVTPWDAYERARYLWYLSDHEGFPVATLASLTRLTERDIQSSIDAYKTMTTHYLTKYNDPNEVLKFSYFVEYESKSRIRDAIARNGYSIDDLCEWIGTRKLPRAADIRDLPDILEVKEAREEFVSKGYDDAWGVLQYARPSKASPLFNWIGRVIEGLGTMPRYEITEIQSEKGAKKRQLLLALQTELDDVLDLVHPRKRARKRP